MAPRHLAISIAALASLGTPAVADAASTLSRDGTEVILRVAPGDTANNNITVQAGGGEHTITDAAGGITNTAADCGEEDPGQTYTCINVTAFRIETANGDDQVSGAGPNPASVPLLVDLGDGSDVFTGGLAGDVVQGGPGFETLTGGDGDDWIDGGFDPDQMGGGGGTDIVSYAGRTEDVQIDFVLGLSVCCPHGSGNDGFPGTRDSILSDVEGAVGGSGADVLKAATWSMQLRGGPGGDTITGGPAADALDGGDGDDTLNGMAAPDTVLGGPGFDTVEARDGAFDSIDCGADSDTAAADSNDTVVSCGTDPDPPQTPEPTIITKTETVTVTLPSRVFFDLAYTFTSSRRGTVLRNLAAEIEPGSRLTAMCRTSRGRRCTRTRDLTRTRAAASARLRGFERRRLPVGARLTIQVTKDGAIGVVKTLTVRRRRAPSVRTLCIPPGASSPSAC